MWKTRLYAFIILIVGVGVAYFVYSSEPRMNVSPHHVTTPKAFTKFPFKLGLDLSGGSHLVYKADVSALKEGVDIKDSMNALRDVIERRVNLFGVSEPVVQVQEGTFANGGEHRLIVDLPGITDTQKAIELIGQTPLLEFRTENPNPPKVKTQNATVDSSGNVVVDPISLENQYVKTDLTGRYLSKAILEFNQNTGEPVVSLQFNDTGAALFQKITHDNVGKTVAIFLDGAPISTPTVQQEITGGKAQISGNFTPNEARQLVGRLNSGALPVPISLISTQTIGPTLGEKAITAGVKSALIGFLLIGIFLLLWYRLPGLIAIVALSLYMGIILALFKLIPVTLSAAGIAGLIISIGMAVDANILIFERVKEEIRNGKNIVDALHAGFSRAWPSIRDSNTSSIITAIILFWFGSSLIQGFALTFGIGVLVSMFSAITISRIFLFALGIKRTNHVTAFLFGSGFSSARARIKLEPKN